MTDEMMKRLIEQSALITATEYNCDGPCDRLCPVCERPDPAPVVVGDRVEDWYVESPATVERIEDGVAYVRTDCGQIHDYPADNLQRVEWSPCGSNKWSYHSCVVFGLVKIGESYYASIDGCVDGILQYEIEKPFDSLEAATVWLKTDLRPMDER